MWIDLQSTIADFGKQNDWIMDADTFPDLSMPSWFPSPLWTAEAEFGGNCWMDAADAIS